MEALLAPAGTARAADLINHGMALRHQQLRHGTPAPSALKLARKRDCEGVPGGRAEMWHATPVRGGAVNGKSYPVGVS